MSALVPRCEVRPVKATKARTTKTSTRVKTADDLEARGQGKAARATAKKTTTAEQKREARLEQQQLLSELDDLDPSAARVHKIVQRLLGAGDDSDLEALVTKLAHASKRPLPDD
jgi:hypothetical protein